VTDRRTDEQTELRRLRGAESERKNVKNVFKNVAKIKTVFCIYAKNHTMMEAFALDIRYSKGESIER